MGYYILFYETVPNYVEKRQPFRADHLQHAENAKENGLLKLAGAFANPANGAAFIFNCEDAETIEEFAEADPYVQKGIIRKWYIREWSVVIE